MYKTYPSQYTPDPLLPAEIWNQPGASLHAIESEPAGSDDHGNWPALFQCDVDWGDSDMPDKDWCESLARRIAASYNVCRLIPIEVLQAMVESGTRVEASEAPNSLRDAPRALECGHLDTEVPSDHDTVACLAEHGLSDRISTGETARRLGISGQRVHQLLVSGQLSCVETSVGRLLDPREVDLFRQQREQNPRVRRARLAKTTSDR